MVVEILDLLSDHLIILANEVNHIEVLGGGRGNGSSDNGITNGTTRQAGGSASSSGSGSGRAAVSGGSGGRGGGGTGAPGLSGTAGSSGIAPANDRVLLDTLLKSRAVKLTGAAKFEAWR